MENDRETWWKIASRELRLLREHWVPLFIESLLDAFFSWFKLFVLATLSLAYSVIITLYLEEGFTVNDFFPPHFGSGLGLALVTMFAYRLAVNSVEKIDHHKTQAELYDPSKGIEVQVFHPDEIDTRLAGIIVTNTKGQSIKATATIRRLMINNRNAVEKQHSFKWETENHYGYATLEHGKPELLLVERRMYALPRKMVKAMSKGPGSEEVREMGTWVILETNTEPYPELHDGEVAMMEIEFWFIINNLYLKDYILQCKLENQKGRLKIQKIRQWMN